MDQDDRWEHAETADMAADAYEALLAERDALREKCDWLSAENQRIRYELENQPDRCDALRAVNAELAAALEVILDDIARHAHGQAAPGHLDHIKSARAALARAKGAA